MKVKDLFEALGIGSEDGPNHNNCFFSKNASSSPRARIATEWLYRGRDDIWDTYQAEQGGTFVDIMEAASSKKEFVYIFVARGNGYMFHKCLRKIDCITQRQAKKEGRIPDDYNKIMHSNISGNGPFYLYEDYPTPGELEDRLIIDFNINRGYNLRCGGIADREVIEILPPKKSVKYFTSYLNVFLDYGELCEVLKDDNWIKHLQQQEAVYLIEDEGSGKHYVGASYGEGGLYERWKSYAKNLTGENKELEKIKRSKGENYIKKNFRYSILEVFSIGQDKYIHDAEQLWKKKLGSRTHGLNDN